MASPAQILANRANAQLSTGPRTPQGKAVSAQNAVAHGLAASRFALMPNEDPGEFAQLMENFRAEFKPQTAHEDFLVETMGKARWKMLRVERLEEAAFGRIFDGAGAPDVRMLETIESNHNPLDKLARYAAAAERSYHKAHSLLMAGRAQAAREQNQKVRVQNEANQFLLDQLLGTPPPKRAEAPVQNEPNSTVRSEPKPKVSAAVQAPGNLALRL